MASPELAPRQESAAWQSDGHVIDVRDLTKRYGQLVAVDGISFSVARGEVFGILGPNGAGKTTTLEMVEGLRRPDGGSIVVDGHSVWPSPKTVKRLIGVQLQATALFDYQKLWEIIYVFGSTYGTHRSKKDCVELLQRVGIADKAEAFADQLSGGQAQRLSIALALVNDPVITFLDEPTTGLDPRARRALWDVIRDISYRGTTVVLTSHYMEEAERLCDRVAVMDRGHIMDIGPPQQLINKLGAEAVVTFTLSRRLPLADLCGLEGVNDCRAQEELGYELVASDAQRVVVSLLDRAREQDVRVENLDVKGATLEDVFLQLTGHKLGDEEAAQDGAEASRPRRRFGFGGGSR